jgi:hypothetical protein
MVPSCRQTHTQLRRPSNGDIDPGQAWGAAGNLELRQARVIAHGRGYPKGYDREPRALRGALAMRRR